MAGRRTYFVADVHLGLDVADPAGREARFVSFLRSLRPSETDALYLLGDIWDFWYEYRDVVPKGYARVFAAIQDLICEGVHVYFFLCRSTASFGLCKFDETTRSRRRNGQRQNHARL